MTSALVALSKTESPNMRELISRVLNALCRHADLRGRVVQQGGTKALAALALDGNEKGKRQAAQVSKGGFGLWVIILLQGRKGTSYTHAHFLEGYANCLSLSIRPYI